MLTVVGASARLVDNYRRPANQLFVLQERVEGVAADVHGYGEDNDDQEEESQVRAVSPSNCSTFLVVLRVGLFRLKCSNFQLAAGADTI